MSPVDQSVPVLVARDLFAWFLLFQPTATMQSSAARSGYCTFGTAHEAHRADGISAARATSGSSRAHVRFEKAARIDASPSSECASKGWADYSPRGAYRKCRSMTRKMSKLNVRFASAKILVNGTDTKG